MPKYDVNIYAVVRYKVVSVEAEDMPSAILVACDTLDERVVDRKLCNCASYGSEAPRRQEQHLEEIEYSEEHISYLVDVAGDTTYAESKGYLADGVTPETPFLEHCESCGADIVLRNTERVTAEFPWHYEDEDCRAVRDPAKQKA